MSRQHDKLNRRRWERVRRQVLDRDNWRCSKCGSYGNECHHITSLEKNGAPYDPNNLTVLCKRCHIIQTYADKDNQVPGKSDWIHLLHAMTTNSCHGL